jgi:betaine-aldehyde dehydrogenase
MSDKKIFANIINGEERPAASGDVLDVIDPSTGEVHATSPNSGPEDVDAACQAAAAAFETYRWTTPAERQGFLLRLADVTEEDEAVALSNDSEYALPCSVWTTDAGTAVRMAARLDFGCV